MNGKTDKGNCILVNKDNAVNIKLAFISPPENAYTANVDIATKIGVKFHIELLTAFSKITLFRAPISSLRTFEMSFKNEFSHA